MELQVSRSPRRVFLAAAWRYLLMVNYAVPRDLLESLVPAGTELDEWQGQCLISLVGFRFLHTRVLRLPVPLHGNFDEVNLRFYVRRRMPDGEIRRGVTFVREVVPRFMIAVLARLTYNEPYVACRMRSTTPRGITESLGRIDYAWRCDGAWHNIAATASGVPSLRAPDDQATFITEHYWGYTRQRKGHTIEYEVSHPQWRVWNAEVVEVSPNVASFYGEAFATALSQKPVSAFIAVGSAVRVYRPRKI